LGFEISRKIPFVTVADRWDRVERLYHAALALDEPTRARFVHDACAGDQNLHREVESLLAYSVSVPAFLSGTALDTLPRLGAAVDGPSPGQHVGPYEITALLGTGGMGDVYRARDARLGRDVAIKILPRVFAQDQNRRARFEREARLLASLNHPHIGAIYGVEERDGELALVLELVEGQMLSEGILSGPLPLLRALSIARQIADALAAAHARGIVHRDLKPANVALTHDGVVKVLDFGLAKSVTDTATDDSRTPSAGGISGTDLIAGTAAYMSPEQARGLAVDERTDIWTFGCLVWAMLTGRPPFSGGSVPATIEAILTQEPEWSALPSTAPAGCVRLLRHCLEKDPSLRMARIAEARTAIDDAIGETAGSRLVKTGRARAAMVAAALVLVAAVVGLLTMPSPGGGAGREVTFTQLTHFTDSAVAPAISPDGRMVAFIRGQRPFLSNDQVYVKMLPDGPPVQLTTEADSKYGLTFSPDSSRIAFTAASRGTGWRTFTVSPSGGRPSLFLTNAAGLTWLDSRRLMFSAIKTGMHMGIVTATEGGEDRRDLYFPAHERSMAHYSFPSPDRRWALIVEMDYRPVWEPCRLIPLDGSSPGRYVGPEGQCSSAGWSPDGRWMYFTVEVDQAYHLWRQRFPEGLPERLTNGPWEEDGVAVAPDGSLITSIGMDQSELWIHDAAGDRLVSSEGQVIGMIGSYSGPSFSADGRHLRYLRRESPGLSPLLWQTDLASGRSELLLPGVGMEQYDISPDRSMVVFAVRPAGKPPEIWLMPFDRSHPPRRIAQQGDSPYFASDGRILFRFSDGTANYLGRMNADGSDPQKVVPYPIATVQSMSPDRGWLIAITPRPAPGTTASMAIPLSGGEPRRICLGVCSTAWSPDAKVLYVETQGPSRTSTGRMMALPVSADTGLPDLPEDGIRPSTQASSIPGSRVVEHAGVIPSLSPDTYGYIKISVQRNLFRIPPPR
jgi:eukaryotic-like serine/threonine-protein kinase